MFRKILFPTILLLISAIPVSAQDMSKKALKDSLNFGHEIFSFSGGMFLTTLNSNISVGNSQLGLGININVEDALGLNTQMFVVRGKADYIFGKRMHSMTGISAFNFYRRASKVLETQIEIGDHIFPIGTSVSSNFNTTVIKGNYDYLFFSDERVRLGASVGLYIMSTRFEISALNSFAEAGNLVAPLPVIGTKSTFWITPKWIINQSIDVMYLKVSNYKGNIIDVNISVEYLPFKNFGVGLGYNAFKFNLEAREESKIAGEFIGTLELAHSGLFLYGKFYF